MHAPEFEACGMAPSGDQVSERLIWPVAGERPRPQRTAQNPGYTHHASGCLVVAPGHLVSSPGSTDTEIEGFDGLMLVTAELSRVVSKKPVAVVARAADDVFL
jgi:hypothetical protein